jgi:hypothetical protein
MMKMKKFSIILGILLLLASCAPKEKVVDCDSTTGSYVCFDNEGREATYARWNFDSVETFNVFNIQGSYPPVPGTTGPWTTVNITLVNSTGSMGMETGTYTYYDFLTNSGERRFTFWVKRYVGDDQDPFVKNFVANPYGFALLNITNVDGSGKLSGVFEANVWNLADTTETGVVKYRFENIDLQ